MEYGGSATWQSKPTFNTVDNRLAHARADSVILSVSAHGPKHNTFQRVPFGSPPAPPDSSTIGRTASPDTATNLAEVSSPASTLNVRNAAAKRGPRVAASLGLGSLPPDSCASIVASPPAGTPDARNSAAERPPRGITPNEPVRSESNIRFTDASAASFAAARDLATASRIATFAGSSNAPAAFNSS